ncbi:30S ribosomal protein S2 [Candidatus Woesearchaeota archaeon]|nr:30S ribosomal protein S2 [Candidatus Woesearchaeota archaeon]
MVNTTTEEQQFLVPLDEYLKVGIHIGTKYRTKYMEQFIYKVRSDGLSVLNIQSIDNRLRQAINLMNQYAPDEIIVVCKRENGWKSVKAFAKATGIRAFAGRYPPGILTNKNLKSFFETKLILVVDPWSEKNSIKDAIRIGVPVIALCDTNNESNNIDLVVPCNNKGKKSLGLIFYIFAKEYLKNRNKNLKEKIDDFTDEE